MRLITIIVIFCFLSVASASFAEDITSKTGSASKKVINAMYGCKDKQVFLRHITSQMSQGDPLANARAIQAERMAGTCLFIKKGQQVKIIDQDREEHLVQVQTANGVIVWTESEVFTKY